MSNFIKNFQSKNRLVADGIIGRKTLEKMMNIYNLTSLELVHLLGQAHHESGGFKVAYENLNYSHKGLLITFKKYFNHDTANQYARHPDMIANRVYANRMGNGNEASGDGWKYRGRGSLQLTGKNNYIAFGEYLGVDLLDNPDLVAEQYFFDSAVYYFKKNNLFRYCKDISDTTILKVSRAVNIGNPNSTAIPNGYQDRLIRTKYYYNLIK